MELICNKPYGSLEKTEYAEYADYIEKLVAQKAMLISPSFAVIC